MKQYLQLLQQTLSAPIRIDRTGTGTRGLFGPQMEFDLSQGFPLLTTKKVFFRGVVEELLWMLSGSTNIKPLVDKNVHIWDEWADADGELGPVYGAQWRKWRGVVPSQEPLGVVDGVPANLMHLSTVDQMAELVARLKSDPFSRRHVVSAWNPVDIPFMKLPPCHCLFQFFVSEATFAERLAHLRQTPVIESVSPDEALVLHAQMNDAGIPTRVLSCKLYQRSADIFLGVPFNIASYALLTHMIAQVVGMIPGKFIWSGGDTHLYSNHVAQAEEQLRRIPGILPRLALNPGVDDLFSFTSSDIVLEGYEPQDAIPAPVSV